MLSIQIQKKLREKGMKKNANGLFQGEKPKSKEDVYEIIIPEEKDIVKGTFVIKSGMVLR